MYKNACRFLQRSAFHVRVYETNRYYFEPENERPLRVGTIRLQLEATAVSGRPSAPDTAMARAMSRAGIKLR